MTLILAEKGLFYGHIPLYPSKNIFLLCEEKINPKKNVGWNRMFTIANDFLLDKFCVANIYLH